MFSEYFEKEAIPEIRGIKPTPSSYGGGKVLGWDTEKAAAKALPRARDYMRLCDIPGFCKLARDEGWKHVAEHIEKGDDLAAQEIEKMVTKFESNLLITTGDHVGDDVAGAVPNIGAYVSGSPLNMRTKRKTKHARGPLSLFLETTTSSGFDGAEKIMRLAAMVALARNIALCRPLNLWLNITYGGAGKLTQTSIQLETNPIDITRVASICSHLSEVTTLGMRLSHKDTRNSEFAWGSWAYGIPPLERKYAGEILGRVISPGSQIAYLPAGLLGVDDLRDPQKWIDRMLRKFAPYLFDGEDREDTQFDNVTVDDLRVA